MTKWVCSQYQGADGRMTQSSRSLIEGPWSWRVEWVAGAASLPTAEAVVPLVLPVSSASPEHVQVNKQQQQQRFAGHPL